MAFREQAIMLGARDSLVGILALPAASQAVPPAATDHPTVVILNAGIIHRAGPNRLHAELARALASDGFPVLRFDLSGIGDSENRVHALPPTEAALTDIREVLDDLEAAGRTARGVIIAGLCSGAFHGLLSAELDPRIVGLVMIDLYLPRTTGYYLRHYGHQLTKLSSWLNLVRGRNPMWLALKRRIAPPSGPAESLPNLKPDVGGRSIAETFEHSLGAVLGRGVPMLAVFTAGLQRQHNYREQLLDAFPRVRFGDLLRLEYFADSDHTFSPEVVRARFMRLVREWAESTVFPGPRVRSNG